MTRVTLRHGGRTAAETRSDAYGDFKFQSLERNSRAYRIEIIDVRFASRSVELDLKESAYLGTIFLNKTPAAPA